MPNRTQQRHNTRWVLSFLAAIVAVLATLLSSATASAATAGVAETRVGASTIDPAPAVGPPQHVSAGQQIGNNPKQVVTVVATGVAAKTADEALPVGKYLSNNWHKGTFPNRTQSVNYHLAKHGKGRTASQYIRDAMDFYDANKSLGVPVVLRDGTAGIKIQTKQPIPGGGTQKVGGYWTNDGKLVTFWD